MAGLHRLAILIAFAAISVLRASADSLDVNSCGQTVATITATTLSWTPGPPGCIQTTPSTSVAYSGGVLGGGAVGNIQNLASGGGTVDQFMTFQGTPLDFVLNSLPAAVSSNGTNCALAVGESCTPTAGSPFVLTLGGAGAIDISFSASGTVTDGVGVGSWSGEFVSFPLTNTTAAAVQQAMLGNGQLIFDLAGDFQVTPIQSTPEPGSVMLLLSGVACWAGVTRRRLGRSAN